MSVGRAQPAPAPATFRATLLLIALDGVGRRDRAGDSEVAALADVSFEVFADEVHAGDVVLVRTGEVIPVDGAAASDEAVVDTSTLTGEPLPVTLRHGRPVMTGTADIFPTGQPSEPRCQRLADGVLSSARLAGNQRGLAGTGQAGNDDQGL